MSLDHYYDEAAMLAVDLVNTFESFAGDELLGSVEALVDFTQDHGLEADDATDGDLDRLRAARSTLKAAVLSGQEAAAVSSLNAVLEHARPRPRLVPTSDGWVYVFADPSASVADRILATAAAGLLEELRKHGLSRFSTCKSLTCDDLFIDQSRNHSRRYCSPAVCGNRETQRAYRARHAADPRSAAPPATPADEASASA